MSGDARLRLRPVKFKNGGATLTVLRPRPGVDMAALLTRKCEEVKKATPGIVGFTIMVWDAEGGSSASTQVSDGSSIPAILVPDFVRNRLLAERIELWTVEGMEDK